MQPSLLLLLDTVSSSEKMLVMTSMFFGFIYDSRLRSGMSVLSTKSNTYY